MRKFTSTINRMHVLCRWIMRLILLNCVTVGVFIGTCNIPGMIAEWDTECLYNCTAYVADQRLYTIYNDVQNSCRTNLMALYAQLLFMLAREWWLFYDNNIYTVHDKRKNIKKDK